MSEPLLQVTGLDAYYGPAHILQGVQFQMSEESVAVVGRNGMGKTTLCAAIMGFTPPRTSGSVRFRGREILGSPSYKIAALGLGYVPQGRRLFPSLTVDEHLRMLKVDSGNGGWTADRVYDLFPRLRRAHPHDRHAERRLAHAVAPDDRERFRTHVEADVLQDVRAAVVRVQLLDGEQRLGARRRGRGPRVRAVGHETSSA